MTSTHIDRTALAKRRFALRKLLGLTLLLFLAATCTSTRSSSDRQARQADASVPAFTILGINDTYRIEGLDGGTRGGLARVRALRDQLELRGEKVLLLHAGDFLYPAFPSRKFDGAQMIDLFNLLDGDEGSFDQRMFVTFGNHEFDKAKESDARLVQRRIQQSQFSWLATDIAFKEKDGKALVAAPNLVTTAQIELGGVRVGLFSLTIDEKVPDYIEAFADPLATARQTTAALREAGAELVIGLTHLRLTQDKQILESLGPDGPDLIVGGHEHEAHVVEVNGRWIFKADADAASAAVIRIEKGASGPRLGRHEIVELDESGPAPEPQVEARTRQWLRAFDLSYCGVDLGLPADCLSESLGKTSVELVAEELEIRRFETNLGNWVADLMVESYADKGAQVAFINSGSLRLNQNLPAASQVQRRHVEELFAYPAPMRLLRVDGRTLQQVVEHAVEGWTGNGWWLQVSGMAFRHDPGAQSATDLTLLGPGGPSKVQPDDQILVVTNDFLVTPSGGQDGYTMLEPEMVIDDGGPDLKDLVVAALEAAGSGGVNPQVEGRICNSIRGGPCLALP